MCKKLTRSAVIKDLFTRIHDRAMTKKEQEWFKELVDLGELYDQFYHDKKQEQLLNDRSVELRKILGIYLKDEKEVRKDGYKHLNTKSPFKERNPGGQNDIYQFAVRGVRKLRENFDKEEQRLRKLSGRFSKLHESGTDDESFSEASLPGYDFNKSSSARRISEWKERSKRTNDRFYPGSNGICLFVESVGV